MAINPASNTPITLEGVYYVENDMRMGLIAIRPSFFKNQVTWDDTTREIRVPLDESSTHWKQLESLQPNSLLDRVALIFRNHKPITLRYLTLEIYDEKLKSRVAGHPTFSSTEDLQKYYLKTDFLRLE